jgi:hypothetical protein
MEYTLCYHGLSISSRYINFIPLDLNWTRQQVIITNNAF